MAFEKYIIGDDTVDTVLSIHTFRALVNEFILVKKTKNEVLDDIETKLGVTLVTNEKLDLQALMDAIDLETGVPAKSALAEEMYHVFIIATDGVDYDTKALLKARLSWI